MNKQKINEIIGAPCAHGGIAALCKECTIESLRLENDRLRLLYKDTAIALVLKGGKIDDESIGKEINKIKADAVREAIEEATWYNNRTTASISDMEEYANKLEALL